MDLTERGQTRIIIEGGEMLPGIYLYSLVADGKLVGTRQMILTE